MIPGLEIQTVPGWLTDAAAPLGTLPLEQMLAGSVYYPASYFDGDPIKFLGGHFHSFVYVDYGVNRDATIHALSSFRGYDLLGYRDVSAEELAPRGWRPPTFECREVEAQQRLAEDFVESPFGLWAVLERSTDHPPSHGPDRFSLLFICGDGVATFQAIYVGNNVAPAVVAVIQPGHGFGGNWTNFFEVDGPLARAVLQNPAGAPQLLLAGGMGEMAHYESTCWPEYATSTWERTAYVADWSPRETRSLKLWCRA